MDGFYQYENLLGSTQVKSSKGLKKYQEEKEKEDNKEDLIKGLSESWITDSGEGILKAGIHKLRNKGSQVVSKTIKKGVEIGGDLSKLGVSETFKKQSRDARQFLQQQATQKIESLKGKASGVLGNVGEGTAGKLKGKIPESLGGSVGKLEKKVETTSGSILGKGKGVYQNIVSSKGTLDSDIQKVLGKNPNTKDLQSALLTQDLRNAKNKGLRLGLDDMTNSQLQGHKIKLPSLGQDELEELGKQNEIRKSGIKSTYKTLSPENKQTFKDSLNEERQNLRKTGIGAKTQEEAVSKDVGLQEKVLSKIINPSSEKGVAGEGSKLIGKIGGTLGEGASIGLSTIGQKGLKGKLEAGGIQGASDLGEKLLKSQIGEDVGGTLGGLATSIIGQKGLKKKAEALGQEAGKDVLKVGLKKGLGEAGEVIAGGGGLEDPLSDIIGFGIGLGSLVGGLFRGHRKKEELKNNYLKHLPPNLQPSVQIGA